MLASWGGIEVGYGGGNGECEKGMANVVGQGRTEAGGVRMLPKDALTLQLHPCSQDTHEERQKSTQSLDFRESWVPISQSVHVSFVGSDSTPPE